MNCTGNRAGSFTTDRIAGGYRLVSVPELCAVWSAYRDGVIELRDVRAYFAAQEMVARRCLLKAGRAPRFLESELAALCQVAEGRGLRASLQRLERAALLKWSTDSIAVNETPIAGDNTTMARMLAGITNRRRRVPVPRRTLRLLACSARPVTIATILGLLIRCAYRHGEVIACDGACSASWIASTFGVDIRNVKRARGDLRALGWLISLDAPHWYRQRYGDRVRLNPDWEQRRNASDDGGRLPPPPASGGPELPPPIQNKKLLRTKNQKPASGTGVCTSSSALHHPDFRHVTRGDLTDTGRVLLLFGQAVRRKWVTACEADRLAFVAAAERALRVGTLNPPGLFIDLVKNRRWHFCDQAQEDAARARLRHELHEATPHTPRDKSIIRNSDSIQNEDIRYAGIVARVAEQKGVSPMLILREMRPTWSKQFFETLLAENRDRTNHPQCGNVHREHYSAESSFVPPFAR